LLLLVLLAAVKRCLSSNITKKKKRDKAKTKGENTMA
jgi:hypothetical protein